MATFATEFRKDTVYSGVKQQHRAKKGAVPLGSYLIQGDTTVAPASYDVLNDKIELLEFPDGSYLKGFSITASDEFDTGGTALRFGVVLDDGVTASSVTAPAAATNAFANQPANDGVSVLSSSVADTTQTATVYGTTTATDTLLVEELALDGTNVVDSVKTDWGIMLAVKLDAVAAGTFTLEEASGNADIKTIAAGGTSAGVVSVPAASQNFYDRLVRIVASEASTKTVGMRGTDSDGNTIYDAQALTGTTSVLSNKRFVTIDEVYVGDLAATTAVTFSSTDKLLATGSEFATAVPVPLNWTGATNPNTELYCDCGGDKLCLLVEAAPTTANSSNVTFTVKAEIFYGEPSDLGTSAA